MSVESPQYVIIVAGGSGSRMGTTTPKQFLLLNGQPILSYTIQAFLRYSPTIQVILVLPAEQIAVWESLAPPHPSVQITTGGATRFQSVQNGLNCIEGQNGLVAVHDGVRPFISPAIIQKSFETAAQLGTAVVSVPSKDSVRLLDATGHNQAVDRSTVRLIQTPQTFQVSVLKKAFQTPELPIFTDDASVAEAAGFRIHLIEGAYENIKITTPEDLVWAEAFVHNHLRSYEE
ncbi:MAG: 2-C-methyl-D-erythritol 4-phosphate cytidylyltransferase [Spirosomataceae bacterium]